ncbi:MAG: fibronectin type III domain-containing protein [candidate division WOR-3 bacterium]
MKISQKLNSLIRLRCKFRISNFQFRIWKIAGFLLVTKALALAPPTKIIVRDTPNDDGSSITVLWHLSTDDSLVKYYEIWRGIIGAESLAMIDKVMAGERCYIDDKVKDGVKYIYQVVAVSEQERAQSEISLPAQSRGQWFNTNRANVLIGVIVFSALILYFIAQSRKGKSLFIRRIAGLDAVEEAVGRATEMGKPILYVPGLSSISDIATIASLNILSEVAKKTAQYETTLLVPNRDPIVYTVALEMVKEAYTNVGRPDVFKPDNIFFVSDNQFAYAAAVDGIMVREKPAANFFIGMFWAESLILAETGATTGAIQIAGTDSVHQLPFFITACDYTLIGEELYAASAYLSREPLLLGSLAGQDYGKMIILVVLLVSSALILIATVFKLPFLNQIAQLFNVS